METTAAQALPVWFVVALVVAGMVAGIISSAIGVWWILRKDRREVKQADAEARDTLIELLKDQNALALENARLEYENALEKALRENDKRHRQEMDSLRATLTEEMRREIAEALDTYGCEDAPNCDTRKPRRTR